MNLLFNAISLKIDGDSHSEKIRIEIDGLPSEKIDLEKLSDFMARRKSGKYAFSTARKEKDDVEFIEGISQDGKINGRIVAVIKNADVKKSDYDFSATPRPSHADYVSVVKYGKAFSGGGRFSGRMTVAYVLLGGICSQLLLSRGVSVGAYISKIAGLECYTYDDGTPKYEVIAKCHEYKLPIPDEKIIPVALEKIKSAAEDKDSCGGETECVVYGLTAGAGGDTTDGLESKLSAAIFSIPGAKSFESGLGKKISDLKGSEANDSFSFSDGKVVTDTDNSGGINGGISNGMPVTIRASFRPTPSIGKPQKTVDLSSGEEKIIQIGGRHDPCYVPRAVVVVESMVAAVILDEILRNERRSFRQKIDDIDLKIAELFDERMALSEEIGKYKKENNLPLSDKNREEEIKNRLKKRYPDRKDEIDGLYETIFYLSKEAQKQ